MWIAPSPTTSSKRLDLASLLRLWGGLALLSVAGALGCSSTTLNVSVAPASLSPDPALYVVSVAVLPPAPPPEGYGVGPEAAPAACETPLGPSSCYEDSHLPDGDRADGPGEARESVVETLERRVKRRQAEMLRRDLESRRARAAPKPRSTQESSVITPDLWMPHSDELVKPEPKREVEP